MNKVLWRETYRFFALIFSALLANMIFLPLAFLTPKKKNRLVIIGRGNGLFSDNAKHFFLFLQEKKDPVFSATFLSSYRNTIQQMRGYSLPCLFYPGLRALYQLLTAEYVVMDSAEWISGGKFQLSSHSKLIQLWHGIPLKEIELPLHRRRLKQLGFFPRWILRIQKRIIGRYPKYHLLLSTSKYITQTAFSSAFRAKYFAELGYPRNDVLFQGQKNMRKSSPIWINCDLETIGIIETARSDGNKIFLYAPTFRSDLSSPFSENILSLQSLNDFASKNNMLFVMKLHPLMVQQFKDKNTTNIIHYAPDCDIYPALSLFDGLITDFSSIYFDYLLLDRPVYFFPYDMDHYIADERKLLFAYEEMTPGPIVMNQAALQASLVEPDTKDWALQRKVVREKVFEHCDDQASQRIYDFIRAT
ncbi:CDP-glycerol glycerophosphotransferase family protein [Desulfobulbus rhabdoformis]|uniref:CDP-glycerol glycerophosphotransferase family protein n=1 Tax=Desulfobulbus rhabdoformis TaxID=34032 RepID=UPI0019652579|nr:CDP-glycerol glycerophosphotransferase family protein [Desulfobulbus rhabdoformis]MBM9614399.1 CDP-glycerol glycerophosphotransferase family protein [Desulfobulbus rhabdoformis]